MCIQLGDTVEVLAVRQARHTGWKAISVVPDSDSWDTIRDIYHTHGTITNINRDGEGVISHKYRFTPSCYKVTSQPTLPTWCCNFLYIFLRDLDIKLTVVFSSIVSGQLPFCAVGPI